MEGFGGWNGKGEIINDDTGKNKTDYDPGRDGRIGRRGSKSERVLVVLVVRKSGKKKKDTAEAVRTDERSLVCNGGEETSERE